MGMAPCACAVQFIDCAVSRGFDTSALLLFYALDQCVWMALRPFDGTVSRGFDTNALLLPYVLNQGVRGCKLIIIAAFSPCICISYRIFSSVGFRQSFALRVFRKFCP